LIRPRAPWAIAHQLAQRDARNVLRLAPRCACWPYVWSIRTAIKVGPDGRVPIGHERLRVAWPLAHGSLNADG